MATTYRFYVTYERKTKVGTHLVSGTTIVTAQRPNLGVVGAQGRLADRFGGKVTVIRVAPYLSGSDMVKKRRADREARP